MTLAVDKVHKLCGPCCGPVRALEAVWVVSACPVVLEASVVIAAITNGNVSRKRFIFGGRMRADAIRPLSISFRAD